MAQNTSPIFPLTPIVGIAAKLATALTTVDGDLSTALLVATGNATNGSRIDYLKVRALGTNVATVLRVFINNGSTPATAANNALFMEATIAATTLSQVAALVDNQVQLDVSLPAGYRIYVTIGTTVSAGLIITAVGGDY